MKKKMNYHRSKTISIVLFLISLCFLTCQKKDVEKNGNEITFSKFPHENKIHFTNFFEFKNGTPLKLYAIDSTLVIYDSEGLKGSFFYNYSLKNNTLSAGYLNKGRGHGEALGIFSTGIDQNFLWAYDISLKKIIKFNTNDQLLPNDSSFNEYPLVDFYYQIALKDSVTFFAVGNPKSKSKVQEINLKTLKTIREFGEYKDVPDNIPFDAYKSTQQCFISVKPSSNKILLFYRYTDLLEIFDLKKRTSITTKGPEGFEADLDVRLQGDGNVSARNKKTRFAFINAAVTDEFIYLLYSGNSDDYKFDGTSNYVYIYDWEGNPVKKLVLDRHINCLTVSDDNKTMYAFDPKAGYIIHTKI